MKTAMQELLESIPNAYEIKMFISENDADEKMLDEFLFERIYKNKNWLEKEKEQIIKVCMDTTAECWISLGVELGVNEDEILNDSEIKKHREEAEEYYNETFKN